jgi:hypothetical protein
MKGRALRASYAHSRHKYVEPPITHRKAANERPLCNERFLNRSTMARRAHNNGDTSDEIPRSSCQAAKRQTAAAKRADIQHKMQKLQKQLADLNAKPI